MDLELLDWLNTHTFVEEAKYQELDYAERAYDIFAEDMLKSPTTRACVFGTIHNEATLLLMKKLENIRPILTPRFIPTCSDELMEKLSVLQKNTICRYSMMKMHFFCG